MAEQNSYPTISEKNWWIIREKFKSSLPTAVSANYFKSLLTLGSDASANSNVIAPMRRVGLLDDEGKTTALANDWRLDNKYKEVCDTIVQNIYPTELLELFPDSDVDRSSARSWFMGRGVGEGAADKMVALFVLLKEGKIKEKKVTTNKSTSSAKTRKNPIGSYNHHTEANPPVSNDVPKNKNSNDFSNRPNLHIDLQIHISPDSTAEQIETIFASMAKHFYGADNS